MQYSTLGRTGWLVSRLGLGGAAIGNEYGDVPAAQATRVIHAAIDAGINYFDTAAQYGLGESERRFGVALSGKRQQVYLTTKAVMRGTPYDYATTMASVEASIQRLQTDYIDLIQLHEAETTTFDVAMNGCIAAFLDLKKAGKVRAIGVNSRNLRLLMPYIHTGHIDTVLTFCRYMLIDTTMQDEFFPLTREHNIGVINGSPLGMGIMTDVPAPFLRQYHDLLAEAERRKAQIAHLRQPGPHGFVEPAMRYSLTCNDIAVTLTGAAVPEQLTRNIAFCDGIGPSESERAHLHALFAGNQLFT
ncbi:MAG: aldo/keto reductase [Chloroflexales bacterium]|nr:aldo/keto reductase [Chloroflexales bacterium]